MQKAVKTKQVQNVCNWLISLGDHEATSNDLEFAIYYKQTLVLNTQLFRQNMLLKVRYRACNIGPFPHCTLLRAYSVTFLSKPKIRIDFSL